MDTVVGETGARATEATNMSYLAAVLVVLAACCWGADADTGDAHGTSAGVPAAGRGGAGGHAEWGCDVWNRRMAVRGSKRLAWVRTEWVQTRAPNWQVVLTPGRRG